MRFTILSINRALRAIGKATAGVAPILGLGLNLPVTSVWAQGFPGGHQEALGPHFKAAPAAQAPPKRCPVPHGPDATGRLMHWNEVAIDASGLDHTPVAPGENRVFGEQFGPCRASRAMAIVHIAMFDAMNAINGPFESYTGLAAAAPGTSADAAIAQAAHDTLAALFPSQAASFDAQLAADLSQLPDDPAKTNGLALGQSAAAAILNLRTNDESQYTEPHIGTNYTTGNLPGQWREDPISHNSLALGAYWGHVRPFVMTSGEQFRLPAPPALTSEDYTTAYDEVKQLGGDGVVTPTERTEEQTLTGIFWAYDGTPSLCAPTRLYNQIMVQIATQQHTEGIAMARLLALANVAMADAAMAVWESKFYYQFWRPVTGIRESDPGTGPTGLGDANPATAGDPAFSPLGAPASNLNGPNFTPPFPSYPSGHAGFGGALFGTLRRFYQTDAIAFTFVSDEFNGVTRDNQGNVRPLIPRQFSSLSQAEEENGQSRIYLGIHWAFDKTGGIAQGEQVADYVMRNAFLPRGKLARR
jgi:membrane-associated phospholipid phosphatase